MLIASPSREGAAAPGRLSVLAGAGTPRLQAELCPAEPWPGSLSSKQTQGLLMLHHEWHCKSNSLFFPPGITSCSLLPATCQPLCQPRGSLPEGSHRMGYSRHIPAKGLLPPLGLPAAPLPFLPQLSSSQEKGDTFIYNTHTDYIL